MEPPIYRILPNPDYDLDLKENETHQYMVDFLLDGVSSWCKIRDRPQTYNSEKPRCQAVIDRISLLLKKITTKPLHSLRERVIIDITAIKKAMVNQLAFFSEETRNDGLALIRHHMRGHLE